MNVYTTDYYMALHPFDELTSGHPFRIVLMMSDAYFGSIIGNGPSWARLEDPIAYLLEGEDNED